MKKKLASLDNFDKQMLFGIGCVVFLLLLLSGTASLFTASWAPILAFALLFGGLSTIFAVGWGIAALGEKLFPTRRQR